MHSHARKLIVRYPAARMLAQLHTGKGLVKQTPIFADQMNQACFLYLRCLCMVLPSPAGNEAIDVGPLRTITRSQSTLHICLQFLATPFKD